MLLGGYGRRTECQLEECCGTLYFSKIAATCPACMLVRKCDLCDNCYKIWKSAPPVCAVCGSRNLQRCSSDPRKFHDLCFNCYKKWSAVQVSTPVSAPRYLGHSEYRNPGRGRTDGMLSVSSEIPANPHSSIFSSQNHPVHTTY